MGVLLTWTDANLAEDGHRIYRSTAPMDPLNLPAAYDTLGPNETRYEDGFVTPGQTYYYRVGAFVAGVEKISEEIQVEATEPVYPTSGLLIHYTGGNVSGTTLVDEQGNQNGTLSGATADTHPNLGDCIALDGGNDRVLCGPHPLGATPAPFAFALITQADVLDDYAYMLNVNDVDQVADGLMHVVIRPSGNWSVGVEGDHTGFEITSAPAVPGQVERFILSWDGATVRVYRNGGLELNVPWTSFTNWRSTPEVCFGQVNDTIVNNGRHYDGRFKSFFLYGRSLTDIEAAQLDTHLQTTVP